MESRMNLEKVFIGVCLWHPHVLDRAKVKIEDFTGQDAIVFKAMKEINQEGNVPDEISIHEKTGISYTELLDYKKTEYDIMGTNWKYYDKQLRERSSRSKILLEAESLLKEPLSAKDMIAKMQDVFREVENDSLDFEIHDIQSTIHKTVDIIQQRKENNQKLIGITSGLRRLDEMTFGFQDRRLYYIGARPSQGKTALLLNFIENCNVCCGVISAESGKEELSTRLLAKGALIDSQRLTVGMLYEGEDDSLFKSAENLYEKSIFIYDEPNPSIDTVVSIAKQMKQRYDIKVLFVDYLQCLSTTSSLRSLPYHQQVAYASKQMKALARTLNIPVVVSAQLRRDAEGNRPQLNDLSDSTQIERDADVVVMIYNKYDKEQRLESTFLLVEKNRDGRCGDIKVNFNQQYIQFTDA
jgi:replicative DNA helicase